MARKRHTPEQIVAKLRQIEIDIGAGKNASQACKCASLSETGQKAV